MLRARTADKMVITIPDFNYNIEFNSLSTRDIHMYMHGKFKGLRELKC